MKKSSWLQWGVAIILIGLTAFSALYIHRAEQKNAIKVEKQAKLDKAEVKKKKELLQEQKKHMRAPVAWDKSSETLPYPDVKKAVKSKKLKDKIWLDVSPKNQRVYVRQGPLVLYTMYASIAKNYDKVPDYQRTPNGMFKLQKQRGDSYYDATKGYGAKYWTSFEGKGAYRFESVPVDKDGNVIASQAKLLGKKVTKKHNIKAYGSIRLTTEDAKWIMENLPAKTRVYIEDDKPKHDPWVYFEK